jgi:electron transport complex protein RnfE
MSTVTAREDMMKGLWRQNPVLIQLLGLCPTLAVTNSVANSLVMGIATWCVLVGSAILVSSVRKLIPNEVRIATYVLIIATFVTLADMSLEALVPTIHKSLGAFIALIVVNCIILGRMEAFAGKNTVWRSTLDSIGMGFGFIIMMMIMGSVREVLGSGTFLGVHVMPKGFEPWVIMVLPPGGFLTLGCVLLALGYVTARKRDALKEAEAAATVKRAA